MDTEKTKQIRKEFQQLESPNARLIDKQMEISSQISLYIRQQGLTQKELAQKADIGESQLSEILRGEGNPTLKTLVKVEQALGKDIIVAPSFHEEEMERKGYMDLPAKSFEQFKIETFDEFIPVESLQAFSDFYCGNITYVVEEPGVEYQSKNLPLAS